MGPGNVPCRAHLPAWDFCPGDGKDKARCLLAMGDIPCGCAGVWQCPWAIQVGVSRWVQRLVVGPTDLLLICSHSPTVKTWEPRGCFEV